MLAAAKRIRVGRIVVVTPDLRRRVFGDPLSDHVGEMHIHDRAAIVRMLARRGHGGRRGVHGRPVVEPRPAGAAARCRLNRDALALGGGWWRLPLRVQRTLAHRARRNTIGGSRRNIEAHYDLGNDFYRLFLDETMTYSSAVFARPDQSLAAAQRNKYAVIAARAGLRRGQHVLEIGTGWGGFAMYAAGELGCRVTTITISPAQHQLATERIAAAGLERPGQRRASRLPRDQRDLRRHRLDRDARGGRCGELHDLLRGLRSGARAGWPDEPPDDRLPGRRV